MKKIFAEIGIGNDTFVSTEIEEGDEEYRIPRWMIPSVVKGVYLRIWLFKTVFIFSTNHGFEIKQKSKHKFKLLFGISGEENT